MEDFDRWVRARGAELGRRAYLLTGDVHLAEDLVQETLARIADRWRGLVREGSPDAYARRVMHNLAIDTWRRRHSRPAEVSTEPPELGTTGPDVERRLVLREALLRLTPRQRATLVLRFYDDLTEVQTAAVLGCSANTVKSQTRQALQRLRDLAPDLLDAVTEEGAR